MFRYASRSQLAKKANRYEQTDEIAELHSWIDDGRIDLIVGENPTPEHIAERQLQVICLYQAYQYLNNELTYPNATEHLSGFLKTMQEMQQSGKTIFAIDREQFLQTYILLTAQLAIPTSYPREAMLLTDGPHATSIAVTVNDYLVQLQEFYPNLSVADLQKMTSSLQGINRYFMAIPSAFANEFDHLLSAIESPLPNHGTKSPVVKINQLFIIPPIAFVNQLIQACNPEHQIKWEPILGQISTNTLYEHFHSQSKHPVAITHKDVTSSLKSAHNLTSSALSILLHDSHYHFPSMGLFPKGEFKFIAEALIPTIQTLSGFKKEDLDELITRLNDFAYFSDTRTKDRLPLHLWHHHFFKITINSPNGVTIFNEAIKILSGACDVMEKYGFTPAYLATEFNDTKDLLKATNPMPIPMPMPQRHLHPHFFKTPQQTEHEIDLLYKKVELLTEKFALQSQRESIVVVMEFAKAIARTHKTQALLELQILLKILLIELEIKDLLLTITPEEKTLKAQLTTHQIELEKLKQFVIRAANPKLSDIMAAAMKEIEIPVNQLMATYEIDAGELYKELAGKKRSHAHTVKRNNQ